MSTHMIWNFIRQILTKKMQRGSIVMQNVRRVLSSLSVLVFFVLCFPFLNVFGAINPQVKLTMAPTIAGKLTYYSYEVSTLSLAVDMSDSVQNYSDATIRFTVPSVYLDSLNGGDITSAVKTIRQDGVNTVLEYKFSQLTGGTSLSIPVSVRTKAGLTPDNYKLPITAEVLDSANQPIQTVAPLESTQQVFPLRILKSGPSNNTTDGIAYYAGAPDPADSTKVSTSTTVSIPFTYMVGQDTPEHTLPDPKMGSRTLAQQVISDTLPAGAVFVQADNPGWAYDAGTRIASFTGPIDATVETPGAYTAAPFTAVLRLRFPGASTADTYTNNMSVRFVPKDAQSYEDPLVSADPLTFKITTTLPAFTSPKYGYPFMDSTTSRAALQNWGIDVVNPSAAFHMDNIVIEDFDLDPRMVYKKLTFISMVGSYSGALIVEAINAGNTATVIASSLSRGSSVDIPAGTVKLRIRTPENQALNPLQGLYLSVYTALLDPDNTHYTGTAADKFYNTASFNGRFQEIDTTAATYTQTASMEILPYAPKALIGQSLDQSTVISSGSNTITARMQYQLYIPLFTPDTIDAQQWVSLLPAGVVYKAGTAAYDPGYSAANQDMFTSLEPVQIVNYKGSGRTALVWTFKKPYQATNYAGIYGSLSYQMQATRDTKEGLNEVSSYLIWDNNGFGNPAKQVVEPSGPDPSIVYNAADTLDFDGDGNTTELAAFARSSFTYVPSKELYGAKSVQGSLDTQQVYSGGRTEIGAAALYQLHVTNRSLLIVDKFTLLDVLPYVGDKTLVPDLNGQIFSRGSQFPVYLTGPITAPAGFTTYYNEALPQTGDPAAYAAQAGWTTAPTSWAAVRGIKIVMAEGQQLAVDQSIVFDMPIRTDSDPALLHDMKAMNTFAFSSNNVNYVESSALDLHLYRFAVEGSVFGDVDKNGEISGGDMPFANIPVRLVDQNGQPALDLAGNPVVGVTGSSGKYSLLAYRQGQYKVMFDWPANLVETTLGDVTNAIASHALLGQRQTALFKLDANNIRLVRNAGLDQSTGDIQISKQVLDGAGRPKSAGDGPFRFEVKIDGALYTGNMEINGAAIAVDNGLFSLRAGDTVWLRAVRLGSSYAIREIEETPYTTTAPGGANGTVNAPEIVLSWTNQEKALGELTLEKILLNSAGGPLTETRTFDIQLTGPSYPAGQVFKVSTAAPTVLKNLILGTYTAKEVDSAGHTVTVSGSATLTAALPAGKISVTNREQNLGELTLQKVLKDTNGKVMTTEHFFDIELTGPSYPGGQIFHVSSLQPTVLKNLIYGTYSAREPKADGYNVTVSGEVKLGNFFRGGKITVTNQQQARGQLTVETVLLDAAGKPSAEEQVFGILVTGPAFPGGKLFQVSTKTPLVLQNLPYGTYTAAEPDTRGYEVTVSDPAVLLFEAPNGKLTVTNRPKAIIPPPPTHPDSKPPVDPPANPQPQTGDSGVLNLVTGGAMLTAGVALRGARLSVRKNINTKLRAKPKRKPAWTRKL